MPYRRLPKTDAARLKALKILLENPDLYAARSRFIAWKSLNEAQPAYDRLLTAHEQYKYALRAQVRGSLKLDALQRRATMYASHFLQVLFMAVERGEIKRRTLSLYGLDEQSLCLPNIKTNEGLEEWTRKIMEGEKARVRSGGRPIYNPTVSMVSTHYDIYREALQRQQLLVDRTTRALTEVQRLRPHTDAVILDIWNQVEKHYEAEPASVRFDACRKFGIIYYYRKNEPHEL